MSEKIFQQVPAPVLPRYTDEEMRIRSMSFLKSLSNRRTIRDFSDKFIEREIIENSEWLAQPLVEPICNLGILYSYLIQL